MKNSERKRKELEAAKYQKALRAEQRDEKGELLVKPPPCRIPKHKRNSWRWSFNQNW